MTQLLELAVEAARRLSPQEQDELARTILEIVGEDDEALYVLSDEDKAAIEVSRAQVARGEFASDEEIEAVLNKYTR